MTTLSPISPIFITLVFIYIFHDCPFFNIVLDSSLIHVCFILLIFVLFILIVIFVDPISAILFILISYEIYTKILPTTQSPLLRKKSPVNKTIYHTPSTAPQSPIPTVTHTSTEIKSPNIDYTLEEDTVQHMYTTRPKALSSPTPKYQPIMPTNNYEALNTY